MPLPEAAPAELVPTPLQEGGWSSEELAVALSERGLILRGGFHPEPGEPGLEEAATVLMVGNAGEAMWIAFNASIDGEPDPLNRWTVRVVEPIAAHYGAIARYPFGEPHWPFQQWAKRAEALFQSPLGLLIHPRYGLWHAWRAALLFRERLELPSRAAAESPCATCADRPCLSACRVRAFTGESYDLAACASHLTTPGASCPGSGCHSRNACPVGSGWRYPDEQVRFHMAAFGLSVSRLR